MIQFTTVTSYQNYSFVRSTHRPINNCNHLGADHLTLRGGGGISGHQEFFSSNLVDRLFFSLYFPISFLLHLCCMQFFSSDKYLQEIFFQNHPPPTQESDGRPLTGLLLRAGGRGFSPATK